MAIQIGLIGDFDATVTAHKAIPKALELAGKAIDCSIESTWIGTDTISGSASQALKEFNGLWCVPNSPYRSLDGALSAIRYARESGKPFLGTCGGFQHALLEYARNVLHFRNATHAEIDPEADFSLIAPLSCSLVEQRGEIVLEDGSRLHAIYGTAETVEKYHCNYGLNPEYVSLFDGTPLRICGHDLAGEVRAIELTNHPFFFATLFQPERSALEGKTHPLITAFVEAVIHSTVSAGQHAAGSS
jgi:CTP synthase (UTP-ammonia lyase)